MNPDSSPPATWRAALLNLYHPTLIARQLAALDGDRPQVQTHLRVLAILGVTALALWALHYAKFVDVFESVLAAILPQAAIASLAASGWMELLGQSWWFLMHLLWLGLVPLWLARQGLGMSWAQLGCGWGETSRHYRGYVLLAAPILLFVAIASQGDDFVNHYPFYSHAGRSWTDFVLWQLLYLSQFVLVEFFFRGFLVNGLRPVLGVNAIYVMCVPYMMIHLPKLPMEALGAIVFGFLLGILALQSRSIWGGVLVHMAIALAMDLTALWQKGAWPTQWWPL